MTPSITVKSLVSNVFSLCWLDGVMSLLAMWDSGWSQQTSLQRTFALSPQLKQRTISSDAPLKKRTTPKGTEPFPSFEWSDHLESVLTGSVRDGEENPLHPYIHHSVLIWSIVLQTYYTSNITVWINPVSTGYFQYPISSKNFHLCSHCSGHILWNIWRPCEESDMSNKVCVPKKWEWIKGSRSGQNEVLLEKALN